MRIGERGGEVGGGYLLDPRHRVHFALRGRAPSDVTIREQ
jgi:hypothetical protein